MELLDASQVALLGHQMFGFDQTAVHHDDDEELLLLFEVVQRIHVQQTRLPRLIGYVERVVPSYSDERFKENFRLSRPTFMFLLNFIGGSLVRIKSGNQTISPQKQLLIALWRLATPDSLRSISEKFYVGRATALRAVRRVVRLLSNLAPQFIRWPTGDTAIAIQQAFLRSSGFPGVIGAIDGTHIRIPRPKEDHASYINRKGVHSIQLQGVCDNKKRFTHIYVGHVGSVHDARVFRLSALPEYMTSLTKFPEDTHLLGDSAYPLHRRLMVPFKNYGNLSDLEKNFNFCHSSGRAVIENAFGLLKGRWRCLLEKLPVRSIEFIPRVIMACCVLHNICIMTNDQLEVVAVAVPEDGDFDNDEDFDEDADERVFALAKRNRLCAQLPIRRVEVVEEML